MARQTIPLAYRQHVCGGLVGVWAYYARGTGGAMRWYYRYYALESPPRGIADCPHCDLALLQTDLSVPHEGLISWTDLRTGKILPAPRKES